MVHRFVQLSDIHFGQERDGTRTVHEDVRRKLLADAADLAEKRGPAHLVIVVGDIAFSGKKIEYDAAGQWLDQLTSAARCGETDVRIVPGNHDCDRSELSSFARKAQHLIRTGTPKSAYADLEDLARSSEAANLLLPKLKAYRDFAAGYQSDFLSVACPLWTKNFVLGPGVILRLVGMNSVQVSDDEDRPGSMVLGDTQYILQDEPNVAYAVIMHHPLEWFMDKAEAKQYLYNRAHLFMVGHEHIPQISKTADALRNERLELYSGATNPPEPGSLYRYTYNWLEISLRTSKGLNALSVTIWPRVWVPERACFAADTQRLAGQESAEFEIACPHLKATAASTVCGTTRPPRREVPGSPSVVKSEIGGATDGTMAMDDDAAMAKLKFLFWRHLDWQQRLKVLVEADALPASANRPVPQTMERLALEGAMQRGKLAAIWDAMMVYVPADKKQSNPFRKAGS